MEKSKKLKIVCLFFVFALLIFGCADAGDSGGSGEDLQQAEKTAELELEDEAPAEDIFAGLETQTYGGREFNILARDQMFTQFYADEETGDIINDAVYRRNRTVEDKYEVRINVINSGEWSEQPIRNSVTAGDGAYDLIDGYAAFVGSIVTAGLYLNLLDVPHLRLTEAWWSQHAVDELTVRGNLYIVPGDITINLWETIMTIFFSKEIIKNYNLENPYELVKNGTWTLDKMIEMSRDIPTDINGDGIMYVEDRFGTFFYDDLSFNNFHNAFDIPTTLKGADGLPYFNLDSPDVLYLAERMYALVDSTEGVIYGNRAEGFRDLYPGGYPIVGISLDMFAGDQILFYPTILGDAEKLRAMETDFGILHYPKRTADQAQYKTSSRDQHTMFGIPVDVKDVEFAGLITEALCVASNKIVIPAYYDVSLLDKFTRDEESAEMLDIIRQGLNFDFGIVFSAQINSAGWIIRSAVNQNTFNFASTLERSLTRHEAALERFLDALE